MSAPQRPAQMREWDHDPQRRGSLRLRVCEWGPSEGRPVVLLHGFLEQALAWERVAAQLDRRVIAPDHRGHGRSEHIGRGGYYHFWDYVGDLDGLIETIGGPVDLVGHSMGGTMACLYAGARPEQVRRLVLIEGLGPADSTAEAVHHARKFLEHRRRPPQHRPLPSVEAGAERMIRYNPRLDPDLARRLAERTLAPSDRGLEWAWDPLHRGRSPVPFSMEILHQFLLQITAPTLVIDGADSGHWIEDNPRRMRGLREVTRACLPGAKHLVHHDQPDLLAAWIRGWVGDGPPVAPSPPP